MGLGLTVPGVRFMGWDLGLRSPCLGFGLWAHHSRHLY